MRILITGGNGMLGRTLQYRLSNHVVGVADLPTVDITKLADLEEIVTQFAPKIVVHCAAMTQVDACETQKDQAFLINALGSANVAIACQRAGVRLIAISTDYVFDGSLNRPYHEWDVPSPATVYGASKLAGEEAIRDHCPDHVILRVAWLYGQGGPSFLHTMLKLGGMAGPPLKVVNDQIGNPTSTDAVAMAVKIFLESPVVGTFHCTCEGDATWYDFTCEIFRQSGLCRQLVPCSSTEYPRPAPRPANSRLEKRKIRLFNMKPMPSWQEALHNFFAEYQNDLL